MIPDGPSKPGLLRRSTSSSSWIFETLVPVLKVVADVLVGEQTAWIQSRTLRTETRNLKIQDGKDVDVLRRPDPRFERMSHTFMCIPA